MTPSASDLQNEVALAGADQCCQENKLKRERDILSIEDRREIPQGSHETTSSTFPSPAHDTGLPDLDRNALKSHFKQKTIK